MAAVEQQLAQGMQPSRLPSWVLLRHFISFRPLLVVVAFVVVAIVTDLEEMQQQS